MADSCLYLDNGNEEAALNSGGKGNLASIYKEMQKPRLTTSARGEGRDQAAQRPATDSGKARVPKSERKG